MFYGADGEPLAVGTRVRNPRLAAFLTDLATRGPDSFYVGPNAAGDRRDGAQRAAQPGGDDPGRYRRL